MWVYGSDAITSGNATMNEQLAERIRQCPNLPSLPAIAVQVLDLVHQPDVDLAEIARTISKDSALTSKILRTVNSSFYARSHAVSTISHALVILGLQSVKTLVLGFTLVANLREKGFKHMDYWRRSIYAATASRSLAAKVGIVQQEEAFLAGLLADVGMLVLDWVMGEEYSRVYGALPSHDGLVAGERACFGMDHSDASAILAGQWKLPPVLAVPMGAHHDPSKLPDPGLKRLAEVVCVASRCADVFVDAEPAEAIADVRRLCKDTFNLAEGDCDTLMNEVGTRAKEIAPLFEISMGASASYDDILKRANETMVELEKKGKAAAAASAVPGTSTNTAAPEAPDVLARLANRERFDAFLAERLAAATKSGNDLSLLLIDLDNFKEMVDQHSPTVGEGLLRAVAAIVSSTARPEDLAARYSGEQIALVLTDMNRAAAITIAEQLRRCIVAKPLPGSASVSLPITVSIGVANFEPGGALKTRAHLTKAVELALHAAKQSGRNCVRVFKLPRSPAAAA